MNLNWILAIPFILSALFLAAAVISGVCVRKAELRKRDSLSSGHIFTSFRIFLMLFFVSVFCALYPLARLDLEGGGVVLKSVLASVINTFRLFFMAGDYVYACKLIGGADIYIWLSIAYLIYLACFYLVAPIFTLGFILSFFRDASSTVRYALSRRSDLYLFSQLNERSLALAEDIAESQRDKRALIVFSDVYARNEDRVMELIASAKRLGALCLKKDVTEVGIDSRSNRVRKIYLIGDDEDENIQQALTIINRHAGGKADTDKLELYVFSNSAESEALLTSVYNKPQGSRPQNMKIRRINENRTLALSELIDNPVFEDAIEQNGVKKIGLVLVGLGGYGTELLKAFCWCSQMAGYEFTLHVFERGQGIEKIRAIAPELIKYNRNDIPFEAHYDIQFHDGIEVGSPQFLQEIRAIEGITRVYVSLGDDELNIETAMRIRSALETQRMWHKEIYRPSIYAIVYSASKTQSLSLAESHNAGAQTKKYSLKNMEGVSYDIFLIGALKTRYTLKNVERTELEEMAMPFHLDWLEKDKQCAKTDKEREEIEQRIAQEKIKYFQFEYYRNSSIAKAVHFELRKKYARLEGTEEERESTLQLYEHLRWNMYMRADGYTYAPPPKSHIAKTHYDLVAFDKLTEGERQKDG